MLTDHAPTRAASRFSYAAAVPAGLLVLAACAIVVRLAATAEPLGIDQGLWASAVRAMSRGDRLYRDVWEQRPPGIYFTYLAGFSVFGWTAAAVAWLDVLAAAATTVLLWGMVRRLSNPVSAAFAAAFYAVGTMPAWLFGYGGFLERSVCETFIVVSVAACAWCAVEFTRQPAPLLAAAAGFAAGAAVVLKPNAGVYLPALLLWMLLHARQLDARTIRTSLGAAALGAVVLPALTVAWLWHLDLLADAKTAVVDFNRFYVGQGFSPATYLTDFSRAVFLRMKTDPIWFAGGVGALLAVWDLVRSRRLPPLASLAVLWGAAGAGAIIVNGARLFNSYFIQVYPPLTLLATWALIDSDRRERWRRLVAVTAGVAVLVLLVHRHYVPRVLEATRADLAALTGNEERATYLERFGGYANRRGYSARANAELADYVRAHTSFDERIFLFGINGADVYFQADRLPAHRFLRVNFFVPSEFPDPRFTLDAVIADLRQRRPRYVIFERLNAVSQRGAEMGRAVDALQQHPSVLQLLSGYTRETEIEDFTLYRRVD